MGIVFYQEPKLERPHMVVSWPGIGNIGIIAVDTLREQTRAQELAEIEPWDFFYPQRVVIKGGLLMDLTFPRNKFYYQRLDGKDFIIFIGEEQPAAAGRGYAEGAKAYAMANLVLDVAQKFNCQRVYTSGAAVSMTHHNLRPRVWAVTNKPALVPEIKGYPNTILMSDIEGRGDGSITGLNGLLLGVAKKRGFDGVCLMGEIPDYLSQAPFPYPRASKSVIEVLSGIIGLKIDLGGLDGMIGQIDEVVDNIFEQFPADIKERIDQRKSIIPAKSETITPEDEKWLKEHIDEFFRKGGRGDERAV